MRLIRSVRRSVSKAVLLSLVISLVLPRVDYGNATLAGLPARQLCRLQSVLHAAARIVFSARKYDHVTPLLRELHWLRVPERITFKLASLVFCCLNGTAPVYLADSINHAADVVGTRRSLRSSSSARGSRFPGRRCPHVEQFTVVCNVIIITVDFQTTFEDVQYDAREKCMSGVIRASVTAQPAVSATPAADESVAKLKQIAADSKDALQLSAASRVPGDVIK